MPSSLNLEHDPMRNRAHVLDVDGTWKRRTRSTAAGLAAGAAATIAMTALLFGAKRIGLLGELPPRKIVKGLKRRMGIVPTSRKHDDVVTTVAHLGFGMAAGALFGAFRPVRSRIGGNLLAGACYGAVVWLGSYYGWVPAMGLMREPHRDRPLRPAVMAGGHVLYGSVLGATVHLLDRE